MTTRLHERRSELDEYESKLEVWRRDYQRAAVLESVLAKKEEELRKREEVVAMREEWLLKKVGQRGPDGWTALI